MKREELRKLTGKCATLNDLYIVAKEKRYKKEWAEHVWRSRQHAVKTAKQREMEK